MEKDTTSFWTDIKKFEDQLAKDPHSYCFAPLSELYRKLGLIDDALNVARRGAEIHPDYIGGHIALGRAYYEKGLYPDAKQSLEKVARATPENLLAQKLLFRIYQEEGNAVAAEQALQLVVAFNPEDQESSAALEAIRRAEIQSETEECLLEEPALAGSALPHDDEPSDIEQLQPFDIPDEGIEDPAESGLLLDFGDQDEEPGENDAPDSLAEPVPMQTATLAELYVSQGFYDKALEVYRDMERVAPGDPDIKARIDSVCRLIQETGDTASQGPVAANEVCAAGSDTASAEVNCRPEMALVEELEKWLQSIGRRKQCQ